MGYGIETETFNGPIQVLYELVKSRDVDIFTISLADVVDGFLSYVAQNAAGLDLRDGTEFLLVAAILLELKSQRLLPVDDEPEPDEEADLFEARDLLLSQLLECQVYSAAGQILRARAAAASESIARPAGADDAYLASLPDLLEGVTCASLRDVYTRVLERCSGDRVEPRVDTEHIIMDIVTVDEAIGDLSRVLPFAGVVTFSSLAGRLSTRIEVIVNFLALLELFKRGQVILEQGVTFGELRVQWVGDPQLVGSPALLEEAGG